MAVNESPESKDFGQMLQSVPKSVLYLLLILACAVPLFFDIKLPNKPVDATIDLYAALSTLPEGSTVLISSDWTNSTRGETAGGMDVVLKILMQRKVKFVLMAIADPVAPQAAKDEISLINEERKAHGEEPYIRWRDWVDAGYFPNGEGTASTLPVSVRGAFSGRKDVDENSQSRDVFESPVLKNVSKLSDLAMFIEVTGTNSATVYNQRLSHKIKQAYFVTGVMGPETFNYYASGQLIGLGVGIKGVYDLETLMDKGVNVPDSEYKSNQIKEPAPPITGSSNAGKGTIYYPSLHAAMFLLIIAVVAGNLGMLLSRRKSK